MFAARIGDMHTCPMVTGLVPHVGGPITGVCVPNVLIGGLPAATIGDLCICAGGPDTVLSNSSKVIVGGRGTLARVTDTTAHGGVIILGCPTVLVGTGGVADIGSLSSSMSESMAGLQDAMAAAQDEINDKKNALQAQINSLEYERQQRLNPIPPRYISDEERERINAEYDSRIAEKEADKAELETFQQTDMSQNTEEGIDFTTPE